MSQVLLYEHIKYYLQLLEISEKPWKLKNYASSK